MSKKQGHSLRNITIVAAFILVSVSVPYSDEAVDNNLSINDTVTSKPEPISIENVEIRSHRFTRADVPGNRTVAKAHMHAVYERTNTPHSSNGVEVYSQEDIEATQPNDLYNVFERAMGMNIARQGSRIHNWVSGRGGEKSALGILLDGIYIPATEAQRVLADIPVDMVESVRIVRDASIMTLGPLMSPGSNNAGSANQGFIIIETKKKADYNGNKAIATLGYGSYNSLKLNSFYTWDYNGKIFMNTGYAKSRNDSKVDRFGDWNNAYDANTFLVNGGINLWKLSSNFTLFYNQAKRDIQRYQASDGTFRKAAWSYDPIYTRLATLTFTGTWTSSQTTQFTIGYTDAIGTGYYDTIDLLTGIKGKVAPNESRDQATEYNLLHTFHLKKSAIDNALKGGVQVIQWYQLTEGQNFPKEENLYGLYLNNELGLYNKTYFDAGFRMDKRYIVQGGGKYITDSTYAKLTDNMWANSAFSVSAGAVHNFTSNYNISARFAYTITPTPELLSTINNKELDPEKRLKYEFGGTALFCTAVGFAVTGYFYDIHNAKVQAINNNGKNITIKASDGTLINIYDNAERLARYGLETSLYGKNIGPFGYDLGYSLFKCNDTTQDKHTPRFKLTTGVHFYHKGYCIDLSALKMPGYTGNAEMPVGNYLVLNGSASKEIGKHLKVKIYSKNLTNEKYTTNFKSGQGTETGYYYDIGSLYGIDVSVKF